MTITLDTPMLGPVDIALEPDARFFGGAYDDATVRTIWNTIRHESDATGIRASLVAAQIAKETGWFRFGGQVSPMQNNFGGLGATNDGAVGASYPAPDQGVMAVFAHHCTYVFGDIANWPSPCVLLRPLDQRYDAVLSTGRAGSVKTIGGYTNGNWAYSKQYPIGSLANGYATGIVSIANSIIGGTPPMPIYPTEADIGAPIRVETTTYVGPPRALTDIDWYVIHDTEGHYEGDIAVLTHGSQNGSIHAIIGRAPGQFCVSVPITVTAWAAGNDTLGMRAIQIELSKAPNETGYTDTQYTSLAAFIRWCQGQGVTVPIVYLGLHPADADSGPLPDARGLIGHAGVPDGAGGWGGFAHHTDPGPQFDWPRLIAAIGSAPQPVPQPTDERLFPETGKSISGMFKGFYEQWGDDAKSLQEYGYPVTDVVPETPFRCQYFERVVMEDHGNYIQLRRLGAAAAAARGYSGPGIG